MASEMIEKIVAAEKLGSDMIDEATQKAQDIIAEAQKKAGALVEEMKQKAAEQSACLINDAEIAGKEYLEAKKSDAVKDAAELRKHAMAKKDDAVRAVVGKIIPQ